MGWPLLLACAALLAASCGGEQSTLDPAGDAAEEIARLWWILLAVSAVVLAVVILLVLVAAAKSRGAREALPEVTRRPSPLGVGLVVVGGVAIPIVVLVLLFVLSLTALPAVSAPRADEAELTVEVTGRQWWWEVRYPEAGVVTANEIHIPARTPVRVVVRTADVIHSFWVPRLNKKVDLVPGRENSLLLEADRPGVYRGQCAEFCGLQHANMALLVVAEEQADFERWLGRSAEPAAVTSGEGVDVFLERGCGGCHAIAGTPADGELGPDLTHVASRRTLAAGTIPNRRGYLGGWIGDPQHVKPGNKMPAIPLDGPQLTALLDYLESLE